MIMSGNLLVGSRDRYLLHSMAESGEETKTAGIYRRRTERLGSRACAISG
jgi:hypothetical protein